MNNNSLRYTSTTFPGLEALCCSNEFRFTNHLHDGHVLWINSGGGEYYHLRGCKKILQPGCVSVIEPGIVHSNHPCEGAVRYLRSLYLSNEFFTNVEKMFTGTGQGRLSLPTREIEDEVSWNILLQLHESIVTKQERIVIDQFLIALFSRLFKNSSITGDGEVTSPRPSRRLQMIIEYMHECCSDEISLDVLANIGGCTTYHIIRLFRKQMGMSPHAYLVQLRLERARRLMEDGCAIVDAAAQAGFSDQSHLTRKFKLRYGITPGRYVSQKT